MKSRAATIGLLLALCACSQQDQPSAPHLGVPRMHATAALSTSPASGPRSFDAIANSPDRGALINYDRRTVPLEQGAYTSHRVQVSEEHAIRGIVTKRLSIPAPGGEYIQLIYERHAESTNGNWTWVGRLAGGDPSQEAIITFGEKAVFGSIPQSGGRPELSLTTRDGKLWVVETDPRLAPGTDRREQDTLVPLAAAGRQFAAASPTEVQVPSASTASAINGSSNTIDLLLGYTTGFAAKFGGQSQAVTRLTHLVEVNNQAYANSQISGSVRLVGTQQVNYTDGGTNKSALIDLTGSDGSRATAVPASLQPLRAARETLGADLVALVRAYEFVNEGCGIAWLLGAGQQPIVPSQDSPFGYSIVSNLPDGTSARGTDGKNYFCSKETLAHELGHLMGSAHDLENAKNDDGQVRYGRYVYSFGAKTNASAGNFYTIMSYGDDGQTSYRVFSSPTVTLCGGLACGVANQTDNARSLRATLPIVASFRATVVPLATGGKVRHDINGDGRADPLWYRPSDGRLLPWLSNGTPGFSPLPGIGVGGAFRVIATGDFNGDGKMDLIWNRPAGDMQYWEGDGQSFAKRQYFTRYPSGWTLVGTGDIDGDGKTDLIWHRARDGLLAYWVMNGPQIARHGGVSVGGTWRVIAVDDFDGDGKVDLIWNRAQGDMQYWQGDGASFAKRQFFTRYPSGWNLLATGDVDGDGKSDMVWHRPTDSRLAYWVMSGPTITRHGGATGLSFHQAFASDFNGDGKLDLLVAPSASGSTYVHWTGDGASFASRVVLGGHPVGYELIPWKD